MYVWMDSELAVVRRDSRVVVCGRAVLVAAALCFGASLPSCALFDARYCQSTPHSTAAYTQRLLSSLQPLCRTARFTFHAPQQLYGQPLLCGSTQRPNTQRSHQLLVSLRG